MCALQMSAASSNHENRMYGMDEAKVIRALTFSKLLRAESPA